MLNIVYNDIIDMIIWIMIKILFSHLDTLATHNIWLMFTIMNAPTHISANSVPISDVCVHNWIWYT